jgi:polysaccharide chain length determinant protein (PEP-CTERM system associated)
MPSFADPFVRPEFLPLSIIRAIWKRKFTALAVAALATAGTWYYISKMPALFYAEALVLVDSQQIPDKYVPSLLPQDSKERLTILSQQILTSDRLKQLIVELKLFPGAQAGKVSDVAVDLVRSNIVINPEHGDRLTAFRVGYSGPDRDVVANVANRLASFFVEENMKERERLAVGTTEFLDSQLKLAKMNLEELETAMSRYKVQHYGQLPEQQNALIGALGRLQAEMHANTEAISRATEMRTVLENSLGLAQDRLAMVLRAAKEREEKRQAAARAESANNSQSPPVIEAVPLAPPRAEDAEIEKLEQQLATYRMRYSETHPDVTRTKALIARLRAALPPQPAPPLVRTGADRKAPAAKTPELPTAAMEPLEVAQARERVSALESQIAANTKELESRNAEQERIRKDMEAVQMRINQLPLREQEMARIMRDYDISKGNYQSLLAKKMAAEMTTDLERRQKSERFTIVDPARRPLFPIKPNRKMLRFAGLGFGVLLGLAAAFVIELRRGVLLGEWELPPNTVVLGILPKISIPGRRRGKRVRALLGNAMSLLCAAIWAAVGF